MSWFKTSEQRLGTALAEERLYAIVAHEISREEIRPGLWLKALAEAGGDDSKARAKYLQLRVEQLRLGIEVIENAAEAHVRNQPTRLSPRPGAPAALEAPAARKCTPAPPALHEQIAAIYAGRAWCRYCRTRNIRPAGAYTAQGKTTAHYCVTCNRSLNGGDLHFDTR